MPRRADAFRGLAHGSRLKVLDAVLHTPGVGLKELSARTGLHENTLRDHVRVLEAEGFIRTDVQHRPTRGRPRTVFLPVRGEDPHEGAEERVRTAMRHGDVLRRIVPSDSGLGETAMHQIDALYEHLDDVGLEPELDDDHLTIELNPCPFDALVSDNRTIVCRVHERLIRDVLVRASGPVQLDRMLPYATPVSCRVQLSVRDDPPDARS